MLRPAATASASAGDADFDAGRGCRTPRGARRPAPPLARAWRPLTWSSRRRCCRSAIRHRQDALRRAFAAAGHRLRLRLDELAHRRWILSGASSQWRNARAGKCFDTLVNGDYANGDGRRRDRQGIDRRTVRPARGVYGLLEPDTAAEFVDEFAEVPVDCLTSSGWRLPTTSVASRPDPEPDERLRDPPHCDGARRIAQAVPRDPRFHEWARASRAADARWPTGSRVARCAECRQLVGAFGNAGSRGAVKSSCTTCRATPAAASADGF